MSRVNFYQLLELKINPPESNPQVIAAAIKRKQAEWSRLRNHPTKGTLARQNISLLTEIRKVMSDSELRTSEARAALDLLKKKLEAKFIAIDKHIQLLGSKGDLDEDDIDRLATFHKVKPTIVQRRADRWRKKKGAPLAIHLSRLLIHEKPDEKTVSKIAAQFGTTSDNVQAVLKKLQDERSAEIEAYINIQIRKGFMAQNEISNLAAIYSIDQGDILRRVRCPIKKEAEVDTETSYQIDSTVEQFINENLKIVEQDSLYSFLGLFPGSTLEALQAKSIEKEQAIRKIAQKDAVVTASAVLAGQCISLFKTDENRYAYDLSRARAMLKRLNYEIDLAAQQNVICTEHYHHLLRKAISFGTPPDKARQHIIDYCQSKKWQVDLPKKKLNLKRYSKVALITLSVVLITGSIFWYFYFSAQRREEDYLRTVTEAREKASLEAQIRVFESYMARIDDDKMREQARTNIDSIRKRIVQRDFKLVEANAEKLHAEKRYEEIDALYGNFLSRHADTAWADPILQKRAAIPPLIDDRDYQNIVALQGGEPEEIAHAGIAYLRNHPDGQFVSQTNRIIKNAEKPYFRNVVKALQQCERQKDWDRCIQLCNRYIDVYRDSTPALKLKEKRDRYQINLQNDTILQTLIARAGGPDAPPARIRDTFNHFLLESPNSPAAQLVRGELARINLQLGHQAAQGELEKLKRLFGQKGSRFTVHKSETFRDSKTGLTWALLDSQMSTGKCMTYNEAIRHIKTMKLGGYNDWRLPTAKELLTLFKGPSPFPGVYSAWYWSSDSYKRYSGKWIIRVDVVKAAPAPAKHQQDSKECGWFRAVRR